MPQRLKDKTVLITGASRGIGRSTAELFAREGASLILLSRDRDALESLAKNLREKYSVEVRVAAQDLTRTAEARILLAGIIEETGRIDIAICNAGIGQYGPVSRTAWKDIDHVLRLNVEGALLVAHALLPGMVRRRCGSIVFISSALGKRTVPYNAIYCASKFALHGFADALRLEVKSAGVHVGVVCPARTSTPFHDAILFSTERRTQRRVPVSSPEKVARAILLCVLRRRREIVVSLGGKFFSYVGLHFPRIADMIISRAVPKIELESRIQNPEVRSHTSESGS